MYSSQLPGNLILRRFGVRNVIGCSVVGWGAVQLGMGFVPRWGDLALCRVLLGACEVTIIFYPRTGIDGRDRRRIFLRWFL